MTKLTVQSPWFQLAVGVFAQLSGGVVLTSPAYLIPILKSDYGMSLALAGAVGTMPNLGMVFALLIWGALADRFGERLVLSLGMAIAAGVCAIAVIAVDPIALAVCFFFGGAAVSSGNVAAGRLIMAWIPKHRRGLAMGIRQMAFSVALAIGALTVPTLASANGARAALLLPLAFAVAAFIACAALLRNPPTADWSVPSTNPDRGSEPSLRNPYRTSLYLPRVHAASTLLIFPQLTLQTFALVFLISGLGWSELASGALIATSQLIGAFARLASGHVSDVFGRLPVVRAISIAVCVIFLLFSASAALGWDAATASLLVIASALASSDNSPAFTAVAEYAGPRWAGRALGAQNTAQNTAAFIVGPVIGGLITVVGYPAAFAILAIAPAVAIPLIPRKDLDDSPAPLHTSEGRTLRREQTDNLEEKQ